MNSVVKAKNTVISRTTTSAETETSTQAPRSDEQLVRNCLEGREEAWSELIDKYKNLIFSVPIKYGFSRDEAADVFQEVCFELLSHLKDVREPQALPKWLLMVASSKCFHSKRRGSRMTSMDLPALERAAPEISPEAIKVIAEAEQEQEIREAIASLSPRCQQLVRMLFFEEPPRPYEQVAQTLGVATGSIGFIRQRCLEFLRKKIQKLQRL
jgi:RNA polymerase sigma factor (sigma-70 family)